MLKQNAEDARRSRLAALLVLLLTLLPLVLQTSLHSYSSGDDLPFHLGSWQDAAIQIRHGHWPVWDFEAGHGAGEPRFVFYPPLSWLLGGVLRIFLTPAHATAIFTLIALAACWIAMYCSAARFTSRGAALVAASMYASAPYMLYNALQRGAFGELLASAWLPLLFTAVLQPMPTVADVALPLALLWMTNVPTAIIGSYMLLLLGVLRLLWTRRLPERPTASSRYVRTLVGGAVLGLLTGAWFLLPALHQSPWVHLNAAFSEGQNFRDNFLVKHTDHTRRQAIHAVSVIAAEYLGALMVLLVAEAALLRRCDAADRREQQFRLAAMVLCFAMVLFLLLPFSAPVWQYLPEFAVLQFPWRLLIVLSVMVALASTSVVNSLKASRTVCTVLGALIGVLLATSAIHAYWRDPYSMDTEAHQPRIRVEAATQLRSTVEYTPAQAPLEVRRPNVAELCPVISPLASEELHWNFKLQQPQVCPLPVRAYPLWRVQVNGQTASTQVRQDGFLAVALPAGVAQVDLQWHEDPLRWVGLVLSVLALCVILTSGRSRPQQTT